MSKGTILTTVKCDLSCFYGVNIMLLPREIVGDNIKKIRLQKGFSGAELADLLFCSQQHISRIERGVIRLNIEQIKHIADSLGVNIYILLEGVGYQSNPLEYIYNQVCYFQAEGLFTESNSLLK